MNESATCTFPTSGPILRYLNIHASDRARAGHFVEDITFGPQMPRRGCEWIVVARATC